MNSDFGRRRVLFLDEVFGGTLKIIKDVLLLSVRSELMPCLAVFRTATKIREGQESVEMLDKDETKGTEGRFDGNVETTIPIQINGILSILDKP